LSEGLGSPGGCLLFGPDSDFIDRAIQLKKALGGSMRQAGVLLASIKHLEFKDITEIVRSDHGKAHKMVEILKN